MLHLYREHEVTVKERALSYSYTECIKLQLYREHLVTVTQRNLRYSYTD